MAYHTINFSDVDSFEPMPGSEWYGVEIDKVEVRENKDGDALYLNWELTVVDGDYENRKLWMITSLKDTARRRLKKAFTQLGVLDNDDDEIEIEYDEDVEPTPKSGPLLLYPDFEGMEASVFVKNEMFDGTERNKVTDIRSERPKSKKRKSSKVEDERPTRSRRSIKDEDDERPARRTRSRRDEEDEDERPARRTRTRHDEEDDEPRSRRTVSRSRRDVEDEDEPRSSRRRNNRDDDEDEDEEEERPARRRSTATRSSGSRRRVR